MEFSTAIVRPRWSGSGTERFNDRDPLVVTDPTEVNRLAGFFPGLGKNRRSDLGGGWGPGLLILFRGDGREVRVMVDEHFHYWRQDSGSGDWPVEPELEPYVRGMVASRSG